MASKSPSETLLVRHGGAKREVYVAFGGFVPTPAWPVAIMRWFEPLLLLFARESIDMNDDKCSFARVGMVRTKIVE